MLAQILAASGSGGMIIGLIGVIWLAKKLIDAHARETSLAKDGDEAHRKVDELTRAIQDRDHALENVQSDLHGEQQARVLAEKHRTELLATLAKVAPAHVIIDGINNELRLLSGLSKAPAAAPATGRGSPPPLPGSAKPPAGT